MIYEVTLSQTDSDLHERIRATNRFDTFYVDILKKFQEDKLIRQQKEQKVDETRLLWSNQRLYVPEGGDIWSSILAKFHQTPYLGNPGYKKMISIVKRHFFWPMLKVNIALFIAKCEEFQLVKRDN